ncbi:hypothetical protein KSP39_PZI012902 [Platanthera zijinensis]|uniref:Uncharacterized protein n=1 Tax=Platanthera zijinensis TaxID=2320716 RepID=A0AAP0BC68_9ASPA
MIDLNSDQTVDILYQLSIGYQRNSQYLILYKIKSKYFISPMISIKYQQFDIRITHLIFFSIFTQARIYPITFFAPHILPVHKFPPQFFSRGLVFGSGEGFSPKILLGNNLFI